MQRNSGHGKVRQGKVWKGRGTERYGEQSIRWGQIRSGRVRSHSEAEDHVQELFVGDSDDAVPVGVLLAEQLRQVLGRRDE